MHNHHWLRNVLITIRCHIQIQIQILVVYFELEKNDLLCELFLDASLMLTVGFDTGGGGALQGNVSGGRGCRVDQCFVNVSIMLTHGYVGGAVYTIERQSS